MYKFFTKIEEFFGIIHLNFNLQEFTQKIKDFNGSKRQYEKRRSVI